MTRMSEAARARKYDEIVEAVTDLFARRGFHSTSMSDVIRHTGVPAGTIYSYFDSKDALIVAVARRALAGIESQVERLVQLEPVPDLRAFIATVMTSLPRDEQGSLRAALILHSWAETSGNHELADLVRGSHQAMLRAARPLVGAWQARGDLPADVTPEAATRLLLAVVQGGIVQTALLGEEPPAIR
ncbi:TetR/AcrR family transcriptional regulator [Cellulomonas hominis]